MAKKIKSINEISGIKVSNNDDIIIEHINPICKKFVGFIRCKIFIDRSRYQMNVLLEFLKDSEVMNSLDGSIENIENELKTVMPYMFSVKFYILYK